MCLVGLGQHRSLTKLLRGKGEVKLPRSWGGHFRNDYDHRDFTAIGAAAGEASSPANSGCLFEKGCFKS